MEAPHEQRPPVRAEADSVAEAHAAAAIGRTGRSSDPSGVAPSVRRTRPISLAIAVTSVAAFVASLSAVVRTGRSPLESAWLAGLDGLGRLGLDAVSGGSLPLRTCGALLTAAGAMAVVVLATLRSSGPPQIRVAVAGALALAGNAHWVLAASDVRAIPVSAAVVVAFAALGFVLGRGGDRLTTAAGRRIAYGLAATTVLVGIAADGTGYLAAAARTAAAAIGRSQTSETFELATPVLGLVGACYLVSRGGRGDFALLAALVAAGLGLAAFGGSDAVATAFAVPGFGALSLGVLLAILFARAAAAVRGPGDGVVLLAAFALFLGAQAGAGARRNLDQMPVRIEAARIVLQAEATLPRREHRGDVVLGVPEEGDLRLRSALRQAGRDDLAFGFEDALSARPKRLRVARYGAPMSGGFGAGLPPETQLAFDAIVDDAVRLDFPRPGAALASMRPEDEPTFLFSLPLGSDPGPDAHLFTVVLLVHEDDGRVRARGVPLDASLTERKEVDGRAIYGWRPSWRSESHADTELRIERGDLGASGSRTWWTVLVGAPHSGACAVARPASAPKNPRFAARFNRPTTCATPASFDVNGQRL